MNAKSVRSNEQKSGTQKTLIGLAFALNNTDRNTPLSFDNIVSKTKRGVVKRFARGKYKMQIMSENIKETTLNFIRSQQDSGLSVGLWRTLKECVSTPATAVAEGGRELPLQLSSR